MGCSIRAWFSRIFPQTKGPHAELVKPNLFCVGLLRSGHHNESICGYNLGPVDDSDTLGADHVLVFPEPSRTWLDDLYLDPQFTTWGAASSFERQKRKRVLSSKKRCWAGDGVVPHKLAPLPGRWQSPAKP